MLTGGVDEYFQRTDSSGAYGLLTDALGSTIALTNSSAAVTTRYTYEPFGQVTVSGATSSNSFQFTGRENDGTGVYYYRARYYSPTLQRFISEDPMGLAGGLDAYAYAQDSPLNFTDPLGRDPFIGATIGAVFGGIYGGLGALMSGAHAGGIAAGVAAGAFTGLAVGAVDPTFGVATLAMAGGLGAAAGSTIAQVLGGGAGPCGRFSLTAVAASAAAGTIGGAAGGYVGGLALASGASAVQGAFISNLISSNLATPIGAILGITLPQPTSGRKNAGCQ